jgi:hypothetical protein
MSVFWDKGRVQLEEFCRIARQPAASGPSPYNHFILPSPDQLLRVCVGLGFKRARLQYVYSILRGKDLETEQFSDEQREKQFKILQIAQARALNLQYWQDFMNCVRLAGFRSGKMISSQNNLLFSYILYLMGRTEFSIDEFHLRRVIARWFFMSSLTGRLTGSPESAMEFDLARFREVKDGERFLSILERACELALPADFWSITLPNDLATSSPRSPSLFAYNASLVLLDARALFSKSKIAQLLDPTTQAMRLAVERHHLFPKDHLKTLGITDLRETNQIANFAFVEWGDNSAIWEQAPDAYLPPMKARFNAAELAQMYHWHALPDGWEKMKYQVFLERRRELIAQIIAEGYQTLCEEQAKDAVTITGVSLGELVFGGESDAVEFKATLRVNLHTGEKDPRIEMAVLKTLAGFLNTNGGVLVIGMADSGIVQGIGPDDFTSEDKMGLHLTNLVNSRLGPQAMTWMHLHFEDYDGHRVLTVKCSPGKAPVFVKDGNSEFFFIRTGPSTTELTTSQAHEFIVRRFP